MFHAKYQLVDNFNENTAGVLILYEGSDRKKLIEEIKKAVPNVGVLHYPDSILELYIYGKLKRYWMRDRDGIVKVYFN